MPMFKVRTGKGCVLVEDKDRESVLERVLDFNGIHVEEVSQREEDKQYKLFTNRKGEGDAGNRDKKSRT